MSEEIKIKYEELQEQLDIFNNAINKFEPYSNNFVTKASDQLDDFNSDFISKMQGALDNMTDTKAPELIKDLKEYSQAIAAVITEFRNNDITIADSFNE